MVWFKIPALSATKMPGGGPTSCEKLLFLPITAGDGLTSCEKHLVLVSNNMAGYMSCLLIKKHSDLVGNNTAGDDPSFHGNHPVLVEL